LSSFPGTYAEFETEIKTSRAAEFLLEQIRGMDKTNEDD
jgi:hypothetical protein